MPGDEATKLELPGGILILREETVEICIRGVASSTVARRNVYGAAVVNERKGPPVVALRYVAFPHNRDLRTYASGIPHKGCEWFDAAEQREFRLKAASNEKAQEAVDAVRAWATPVTRRIFVVANPFSGRGKGAAVADLLKTMARDTAHDVRVLFTSAAGEAVRIARGLDDWEPTSIVAGLGGDGTMCEVLEGLLARPDGEVPGKYTCCYVPAGTSNAMAQLLGGGDPVTAVWAMLKGRAHPSDLFEFRQGSGGRKRYGALSVTSSIIADIDIASEMCRCCGANRFTMYTIMKLFCCFPCLCCCCGPHPKVTYPMRIRYKEARDDGEEAEWQSWEGTTQFFQVLNAPSIDKHTKLAPASRLDDGKLYLSWTAPVNRFSLVGVFGEIEEARHHQGAAVWTEKAVTELEVTPTRDCVKVVLDGESCDDGVSFSLKILPRQVNFVTGSGPLHAHRFTDDDDENEPARKQLPGSPGRG
eukprot:Rhum_TRINITY_DN16976_c0_g1::Rhum_TRINITY_DN16976_c0_g1_i1::g.164937::m.164937/K04718/SPHK; sphingosine kinase